MRFLLPALLLSLLLSGCSTLRPPAASPSPLPEWHIAVPPYQQLNSSFTECKNFNCKTQLAKPILVVIEQDANYTTFGKRGIPFEIPSCTIEQITFDNTSLLQEKRLVPAPDYADYYVLHYFIPLKKGKHSVKVKGSCQLRGNTYSVIVE